MGQQEGRVPWIGMEEQIARLEAAPREVDRTLGEVLDGGADDVLRAARAGTPVRTGMTAASWQKRQIAPLEQFVRLPVRHAPFITLDDSAVLPVLDELDREIERQVDAVLQET
jgi:hypothetical protein